MRISYQGRWLGFMIPFFTGKFRIPMTMMKARNMDRRDSGSAVLNRVMYRQYREKLIMTSFTRILGTPSQTRVLDSRSNFFMTASTSSAVPTSTSWTWTCSSISCSAFAFFLKRLIAILLKWYKYSNCGGSRNPPQCDYSA